MTLAKSLPPIELLRQRYRYDADSGLIYNNKNKPLAHSRGKSGSVFWDYRSVYVFGKRYYYHRIAWALHYGEDPSDSFIDHIDGNRHNNKVNNLRKVSHAENMKNKRPRKQERYARILQQLNRRLRKIDMDEKKLKIISASVCRFNVHIDIDGSLAPEISPEACEEPCDYCRMVSEYILRMIDENSDNAPSGNGG